MFRRDYEKRNREREAVDSKSRKGSEMPDLFPGTELVAVHRASFSLLS